ncbi:MAG: MFS transporter [Propionibacteriaceae bacterium]|nr:MFS transporter [Propionibacteriaceae bacterium]
MPDNQESPRTPWIRNVTLFLFGQSVSLFGSAIVGYSVIWYITLKTGSGGQFALLLIASSLAMAVTTIPGGIWADRYWRKALMIGSDAGVAAVTVVLAVLMLNGLESVWVIAVALAIRGLGSGIQSPAVNAALPQIAPAEKLMRVNSINQAIQAVIQVAAPALAAVLLVYFPLGWILMVDVTTAIIGITVTVFIRIPRLRLDPDAPRPEGLVGYVSHMGEAVRHTLAIPGLRRGVMLVLLIAGLLVPFAQLTPVFVVRLYGSQQWMLAATEILWSVGMVIAGLVLAAWGGTRNRMTMLMLGTCLLAVCVMVMGMMPNIWLFLAVMVIQGLTLPMVNTPALTSLQEHIPEAMMGRVMGFITLIMTVCGPLGMAVIGPLADHMNLSWMAFAAGAAGIVILVAMALRGGPGSQLYAPVVADESAIAIEEGGDPQMCVVERADRCGDLTEVGSA